MTIYLLLLLYEYTSAAVPRASEMSWLGLRSLQLATYVFKLTFSLPSSLRIRTLRYLVGHLSLHRHFMHDETTWMSYSSLVNALVDGSKAVHKK
jgi:hypothetical protein